MNGKDVQCVSLVLNVLQLHANQSESKSEQLMDQCMFEPLGHETGFCIQTTIADHLVTFMPDNKV